MKNILYFNEMFLNLGGEINNDNNYYKPELEMEKIENDTNIKYLLKKEELIGIITLKKSNIVYPEFEMIKKNPFNWFRCISMLGPILTNYIINNHPNKIILQASNIIQEKRYRSSGFIKYIKGYIGHLYDIEINYEVILTKK